MKVAIVLMTLVSTAQAAGSGAGHGSVADLMWPAINFVLLASFLVWKIKKPLRDMFEKNANDVKYLFEHAEKKDKEATIKLAALQEKMGNLEGEKNKILKSAEKEADDFISRSEKESKDYLRRLEMDSDSKLEYEKTSRVAELEETLVDEVISKAKCKIGSDKSLSDKVTKKLITQIR